MRSKGGLAGLLLFIPFFASFGSRVRARKPREDGHQRCSHRYLPTVTSGIVNYCPRPETFSGTWTFRVEQTFPAYVVSVEEGKEMNQNMQIKIVPFCIFVLSSRLLGESIGEYNRISTNLIIFINYRTINYRNFCI